MTQLTEHLNVWELWYFKAVTSYRGKCFQVPTRLTTVTRQIGEYKVDLTRHPKFPLAFGERSFPTLSMYKHIQGRTSFFTPARFKSCLFFKFLLIYSKPCLVQLPRPYSFQKISWPPLDYLLWSRSSRFCQEFAWVEDNMDPKWK